MMMVGMLKVCEEEMLHRIVVVWCDEGGRVGVECLLI